MVITWQQLKEARKACGLTQAALAELLDVHPKTIVNWEADRVPKKSEYKVERVLGKYFDSGSAHSSENGPEHREIHCAIHASPPVTQAAHAIEFFDLSKENIALLTDRRLTDALATELRLELAGKNISLVAASKATGIKSGLLRRLLAGERRTTFLEFWQICTAIDLDPQRVERQAFRSAIHQAHEESHKKARHEARLVKHAEQYL